MFGMGEQKPMGSVDDYIIDSIHQGKVKMVDVARAVLDKRINYDNISRGLNDAQKQELDKQIVGLQGLQRKLENPYGRMM